MIKNAFFGKKIHIVGIKGTGCAALVGLLLQQECRITGSDGPEDYYTSALLKRLGVAYQTHFAAENLPIDTDFVIYSAAYENNNIEISAARARHIPLLSYPEALGLLSQNYFSVAIAGVHGKSTTSAMCGAIAQALNKQYNLQANVLVGSAVPAFQNQAVLLSPQGGQVFIAETCEYRRHFLHFCPQIVLVTAVEWDHQDYFTTPQDIDNAFYELCQKLPQNGYVVACADNPGVQRLIARVAAQRPDITIVPYGKTAKGSPWHIQDDYAIHPGDEPYQACSLVGVSSPIRLKVPGYHNIYNATATLAIFSILMRQFCPDIVQEQWMPYALQALAQFTGAARRAEIIGTARGVFIMDDYGHHPTAIATTLAGLKEFYRPKRLVVSFMSHTFTRTNALFEEFAQSLSCADVIVLHKIYASAREVAHGERIAEKLYQRCVQLYPEKNVVYFENPIDALPWVKDFLQPGDLFLTLGAGDNFVLSHTLYKDWTLCSV